MATTSLKTVVELSFRATDTPSYDLMSPSDPMVVLFQRNNNQLLKVGRTEPIKDNANPVWTKKVKVDYAFEAIQNFTAYIYDIDNVNALDDLSKQELIGTVDFTLAELMSSANATLCLEVWKEHSKSERHKKMRFIIQGFEIVESRLWAKGQVCALDLKKHGFFSQDDTSLEICKKQPNGPGINVIWQSAIVKANNKDPKYEPFDIPLGQILCGIDDLNVPWTLRVVRVRRNGYQERIVIGEVTKPVCEFLKKTEEQQLPHILKNGTKETGKLLVSFLTTYTQPTFLDYIQKGLQLRLAVMIDFTASNNDNGGQNLHALRHGVDNEYQRAIRAVGGVLTTYCKSNSVLAIGYGAEVSVDGKRKETNFCFPLTLSTQRWHVSGVDELLYAYDYALKSGMSLSGPTFFEPGLKYVSEWSKVQFTDTYQAYTILLILTDGLISDMAKTVTTLVQSSSLPFAVVICGVGNLQDWSSMNRLDGDEQRLTCERTGAKSVIDNVQFFPLRECGNDPTAIQSATLAEIPQQFIQFAKLHNIKPMDIAPTVTTTEQIPAPYGGYVAPTKQ
eukprot:UN00830